MDHLLEFDTILHSWQVVGEILKDKRLYGVVCFIGMPVMHYGKLYNCSLIMLNGKILGIRAKMNLADNDGYCESRWFGKW
jgi:NAD+ synthase (glutamine-hydrolysing)